MAKQRKVKVGRCSDNKAQMLDTDTVSLLAGLGIPLLVFTGAIVYHCIYPNPQKVPKRRRK